jgi:uncharacterized protein (DUF849 family)
MTGARRVARLQACLNGARPPGSHPALPLDARALSLDARAAAEAGAASAHLHPRDATGAETLDAGVVDATARAVREASGLPVGVSTGEWIAPDVATRVAAIEGWSAPDFASVNLSEDGAGAVMAVLLDRGIGVEAGLATVEDVGRLVATGLAARVLRVLVEVEDLDPAAAVERAAAIDDALDGASVAAPRLHHGLEAATWPVLERAVELGHDVRVGLEDTLVLPSGRASPDNAALVIAALNLIRDG